jgi:hypothetical protein
MPTITVTVIEHAATERKQWRVTAHDGTLRLTMPVIVGWPIIETDREAIRALLNARSWTAGNGQPITHWSSTPSGLSKNGHRRYRMTY